MTLCTDQAKMMVLQFLQKTWSAILQCCCRNSHTVKVNTNSCQYIFKLGMTIEIWFVATLTISQYQLCKTTPE
uniref:Putative secreted protein n=1 Tax=Panstrongylus lignarius TaxID=156445 RepID=A0A224XXJ9_9HEMI